MMDKVPSVYRTSCIRNSDKSLVWERNYEAISNDEAEARAMLNCIKSGNKREDVSVKAERLR
jgi:hypothetical protein